MILAGGKIVTSGTVDEIRGHVSQRRVTCTTELSEVDVRDWPAVEAVERRGRLLEVTTSSLEGTLRQLLNADSGLSDLQVHRAGLAQAFVQIDKGAVRG